MMESFRSFYKIAEVQPDKIAIYCEEERVTYAEFTDLVNRWTCFLHENGVKYKDFICVLLPNEINFAAVLFAAANIGAAIVPLSPALPVNMVGNACKSSDVKHIVAHNNVIKELRAFGIEINGVWADVDENLVSNMPSKRLNFPNVNGSEPLILTLTSGSTGDPKPIIFTQQNKIDRADAVRKLYSVTSEDVILAATPLYHSLAERLIILPLLLGATSVIMARFTPELWLKCIKERKVTFSIAVSSQLAQIAKILSSPFLPEVTSLRCLVSSSALLESHVKNELLSKLKCDLHECYGTSEIAIATDLNMADSSVKLKSVGKSIHGVDVRILKDDNFAKAGEIGEIVCKTPMLFAGYYNLPELTKQSMYGDYFKTGDLGYLDEDGYLYFVDRKKDLIITGAVNVYPGDIESEIQALDSVKECAVFPYPDEHLGEIVAAAVVPNDKNTFNLREVMVHCAKKLADFQQPRKYFVMDVLPRNNMGKLLRRVLADNLISNGSERLNDK